MSRGLFKALTAYRLPGLEVLGLDIAAAAEGAQFAPCGPTQPSSAGFVSPRGTPNSALAERTLDGGILKILVEQRLLPGSVVRDRVDEMARAIEQESGRKPGAKRRRELKDEALLELLPKAFTKRSALLVWIAPRLDLLVIDSTSTGALDLALTLLTRAMPGLAPQPLQTAESPAACMKAWLADGVAPAGFGIGRRALLRSPDTVGATVKYLKHSLDGDNVLQHLREGKEVRELALNWKDRLDFVLTDSLQLKSVVPDIEPSDAQQDQDPFDAEIMLATGELSQMLPALFEGLGGRIE